ncbi:Gti1/Pac2 family-domain-containing protein [Annulohypoxylon maeteangense]|uniref:Gti1/Pac2 family-domain-containing protein n=1 Tax=Annulohypoxylon maeteangense TaxID=1927788 RepID=UPI0020075623|nr:Gti1/Pac2 family-domain-containing protein [Annulohypoxylon maeteangense]KAI0883480.1 Gti1/Pac2 family-domain-containing protein [Annulohypoxylon maeteangense]
MSSGGMLAGADRPTGPSGSLSSGHTGVAASPLQPTFRGYIASTMDALILFEACLSGHLFHVPRRPHDRERAGLIVSGNVFIYEEHSSGIKRWTDGVPWSPSRILGNFLLYRELDKPFQPGEKKRAMKRSKPNEGVSKPATNSRSNSVSNGMSNSLNVGAPMSNFDNMANSRNDAERALVGSLIDSYQFKQDGLVKKTISVTYQGIQHHMVSYYSIDDIISHKLITPAHDPSLRGITPRGPLISSGSFRAPVDDQEILMTEPHFRHAMISHPFPYMNSASARSMSMPTMPSFTQPTWGTDQYVSTYTMAPTMAPTLPPPVNYAPPVTSTYNYESSSIPYGMTPRSSVGFPHSGSLAARRHSNVQGANGISHLDYNGLGSIDRAPMGSSQYLGNGSSLANHGMTSQSSYSNGAMFESSAAAAAAAAAAATPSSNHHRESYDHNGTSQSNEMYTTEPSGRHSAGFVNQLDNGFDSRGTHQAPADFSASLSDHTAHNVSSSQETTPPAMPLGLDSTESPSNMVAEQGWASGFMGNDNFSQIPKSEVGGLQNVLQNMSMDELNNHKQTRM